MGMDRFREIALIEKKIGLRAVLQVNLPDL